MSSEESYKVFIDSKFIGIDRINESSAANFATLTKLVRLFRDYISAQDSFAKATTKTSGSLAQLASRKQDCLHPMLETLATTFCVFSNVQREFVESFNNIVKSLTIAFENNEANALHILTARHLNTVSNFKSSQIQLEKSRQKYVSISGPSNDNSQNDERIYRMSKRIKDGFEMSIDKYNNLKSKFYNVVQEGFEKSKKIQLAQLETMRKCIKNVGNALAKFLFDMKESVHSLKYFYKTKNKEYLFQLWLDSNKTVDDVYVDSFPEMVLETVECPRKEDFLIDINTIPCSNDTPVTNNSETKKRIFQSRKNQSNVITNDPFIIDKDIPDIQINMEINAMDKKNDDKINISALKGAKRKWTGLNILKKFRSTNDLSNEGSDLKESVNEECWQSKSNLNENVLIDDEGFIIRDTKLDSNDISSDSSSSNSSDNRLRGIKVNIRPVNNSGAKMASRFEVINAAMQLPNPKGENFKVNDCRRVSNLQRSSKLITESDKDRFTRRSFSVSELRNLEVYLDSPVSSEEKSVKENILIPIACAMTEILSSTDGGVNCTLQGQLVLALPIYIKDHLRSSKNIIPEIITLELLSDSYSFSSAKILKQYQNVAKLEIIDSNKYNIQMHKELLEKVTSDLSLSNKGSRISFPLLEYSVEINENTKKIIECHHEWSKIEDFYIFFNFTISSKYVLENKHIKVKIKLLSSGIIEDLSSEGEIKSDIFSEQYRSVKLENIDNLISVKIKNESLSTVKLQLSYDFVFDSCSLVKPHLLIKASREVNSPFKISLIHYRTISTANFSQVFNFSIS